MKRMLMLLSTGMISLSATTSIFGSAFISCRSFKNKKAQTTSEEEPDSFEYGSLQETNKFSKYDFNKYVDSSLTPIISLLSSKVLDQNVDKENFDFITVFNSLLNRNDRYNLLIWNKQSVNDKEYCVETFLNDWTFSELEQKDINLIKSMFIEIKTESKIYKTKNRLDITKYIKSKKKFIKDNLEKIKYFINRFNNADFKKNVNIDTQILNFIKMASNYSNKNVSPLFLKVQPRFEQIFNNFISGTDFNDIEDLTNVNGQNLISYIKEPENLKKMNEDFKNKTNNEKALMLFMIKFNYMYKYISSDDANPKNGHFLHEALFENAIEKFNANYQKIIENFTNYFKDIFENNNSTKSLEPLYCLIEGITYIIKQKFYQTEIDQPITNSEIKIENIFECICEFVSIIKNDSNNDQLKYFNIKKSKDILKDLLIKSSLFEGIFIEYKTIASTGVNKYWLSKLLPYNNNLKNVYNSVLLGIIKNFTVNLDIEKMVDDFNFESWIQNFLNKYRENQKFKAYIQTFDEIKDIIDDKDNNFLQELQSFIDNGGIKKILSDFYELIKKIIASSDELNDKTKKQEFLISVNTLLYSIGIDRQKKSEDILISGSFLDNLINWINDPNNSFDKTFDSIIDLFEQKYNKWIEQNFENQIDKLAKIIKDKKDEKNKIEIKYIDFKESKNNNTNLIIKLNYHLKLLSTNEVYNIEFKNKDFKKFPKNFKISKFEKLV